jgi:ligand-binding sensor domain-containing protein
MTVPETNDAVYMKIYRLSIGSSWAPFVCLGLLLGCDNNFGPPPPPGPQWVVFTTSNSPLVNNRINTIEGDAEGRVWFGTDGGASAFSRNWLTITDSLNYLTYDRDGNVYITRTVSSIALGKDGSLWFGLLGGGIRRFQFNGQTTIPWARYDEDDGLVSNVVRKVTRSLRDPGDLYFATPLGISRFTPRQTDPRVGEWSTFTIKNVPELMSNDVTTACADDNDDSFWFGTTTGVVVSASYELFIRWADHTPPDNHYAITDISFDNGNNPWIGTFNGAWKHDLNAGTWIHYDHSSSKGSLPRGPVNVILIEKDATVWFGTNSGLVQMRDTVWQAFTAGNSSLPNDTITALREDYRGNLWIGTVHGVAAYNEHGTSF